MKTSIKNYCRSNHMTLDEFFFHAWKETKKVSGGAFIKRHIELYRWYGVVPQYVSDFLETVPSIPFGFIPYYAR